MKPKFSLESLQISEVRRSLAISHSREVEILLKTSVTIGMI
jgi:hypothetical protein